MIKRAAVGIVLNSDRHVLMARRSVRLSRYAGQWEFPGGATRDGESILEALARELWEEVGVVVGGSPVLVREGRSLDDEGADWWTSTFLIEIFTGRPHIREPEKCAALGYFDIGHPPSPLMESAREDIASLKHLIGD